MTNATTNMIHETTSMDCTSRIHYAMRADGQWFSRWQGRDPRFGYKWGAWRKSAAPESAWNTGRTARLPKEAA